MQINPEFVAPLLPALDMESLPEVERNCGEALYLNLFALSKWNNDFTASVSLFHYSKNLTCRFLFSRWGLIAARNGGLALRNYLEHLASARGVLGKVPSWKDKIDYQALKLVSARFKERFPRIEKLRHAVAHPEYYADPTRNMKGGRDTRPDIVGAGPQCSVQDAILVNTYCTTIDGMSVSYDMTDENVMFLLELTYAAFTAVNAVYREQPDG